jgi:membrane protease YdiL (CAAX protease family)
MFPHTVLLVAFIIYLLSQEGVGLLASLALYPVHAQLAELPASTLLRLTQLLQIVAYIPILALPLLVLRRRVRYDPLTGERIGWRSLLAYIGFRTRNPLADIGAGALGYLLITPAVVIAGLISNWLFARYHTPQNPAALEMLAAQGGLDRFLIFFIASVAAPFAEETFFRGILYSALRSRLGVWPGAALSAAIFAIVHPTLPGGFLPIWAVGMGLALVYEWRQSLLPGMVLHGLYNGMITLTIFAVFAR